MVGIYHPVHYSVTNIDCSNGSGAITLAIKVNTEDLEFALSHNFNKHIRLNSEKDSAETEKLILNYFNTSLKISINNTNKPEIIFKQKVPEKNDTWLFFNVLNNEQIDEFKIMHALLFDVFMDQTNLIIFSYNGKEKGFKTTFYDRNILINTKN